MKRKVRGKKQIRFEAQKFKIEQKFRRERTNTRFLFETTRTEDPTSGTKATLASNPLPERFGDSDLADCATRSLQV